MMADHSECKRQFRHLSRAWYGKEVLRDSKAVDEIMIGFYHPEGGSTGEFVIEWISMAGTLTPRLKAFDDSWSALWEFRDLLEIMAVHDGEDLTPEAMCGVLAGCGISDATATEFEG
jgi:hypothetical protein